MCNFVENSCKVLQRIDLRQGILSILVHVPIHHVPISLEQRIGHYPMVGRWYN